jgi:hypothetical protein
MKLYELAYACRLYQGQFDDAYRKMRVDLGDNPKLDSPEKRKDILDFLDKWGCRIPKENFPGLEERVEKWVKDGGIDQLPDASKDILSLSPTELEQIAKSFGTLLSHLGGDTRVAKTLHALRYRALPAWDARIKEECVIKRQLSGRTTAGKTYSEFLARVKREIEDLQRDAKQLGYSLIQVPQLVNRVERSYDISLVKLVDEYFWMTITSGHKVPDRNQLKRMASLGERRRCRDSGPVTEAVSNSGKR